MTVYSLLTDEDYLHINSTMKVHNQERKLASFAYKELVVWQKSMLLAKMIYQLTNQFPKTERYGFCSQMQRCSVAIPSDIAEGAKRSYKLEFIHMLSNANGSAAELETQLLLSRKI